MQMRGSAHQAQQNPRIGVLRRKSFQVRHATTPDEDFLSRRSRRLHRSHSLANALSPKTPEPTQDQCSCHLAGLPVCWCAGQCPWSECHADSSNTTACLLEQNMSRHNNDNNNVWYSRLNNSYIKVYVVSL